MISQRKRPTLIRIPKDSPYYLMSYRGYISPARLTMAQHLERCLGSDEYIYFLDGNSFNSSIDNIALVSHKESAKLSEIRRVTSQMDRLSSYLNTLKSQLEDIRFRHTPCDCTKCKRSIQSRQASYKL